ncbi:hypothetical protein MMC14_003036 [Varicellaria rhodocarpa]|nr:hypothetical protein [Varicellaria rhodocarpa]
MESSVSSLSEVEPTFQTFRFFDLPPEIRNKILSTVYYIPKVIDVDDVLFRRMSRHTRTFIVSKKFHEEASGVFYGINTFRLFPTHGQGLGRKIKPVVSSFSAQYRAALHSLELRLGPMWHKIPACWKVTDTLGLEDMVTLRQIKVFVQIDPSHEIFNGFRSGNGVQVGPDFYTDFAGNLLEETIARLPVLEEIAFDTWPSVKRDSPLMKRLLVEGMKGGLRISWGSAHATDKERVRMTEWFTV